MSHLWWTSETHLWTYGAPMGTSVTHQGTYIWHTFEGHLRHFFGPMGHLWRQLRQFGGHMGLLLGTSETHCRAYGAPLKGQLRHFGVPMGHLWGTCEALCGTYRAPLGDM